jgi:hypothetical protein
VGASVVACRNPSPVLELGEQVFHPVPDFVSGFAAIDRFLAVFLRRNAWVDFLLGQQGSDFVAVIPTVPDQGFCLWQILEQDIGPLEIAALPFGQVEPHRSPGVVTQGVQLCVQPALGAPDQPWLIAPF